MYSPSMKSTGVHDVSVVTDDEVDVGRCDERLVDGHLVRRGEGAVLDAAVDADDDVVARGSRRRRLGQGPLHVDQIDRPRDVCGRCQPVQPPNRREVSDGDAFASYMVICCESASVAAVPACPSPAASSTSNVSTSPENLWSIA